MKESRKVVDDIVASNKGCCFLKIEVLILRFLLKFFPVVYGVTTGFGKFENVAISKEKAG